MRLLLSLLALLAATAAAADSSELRRLVTLSRHGSRAPNPVAAALCPLNAANLGAYHVPPEQLTEVGMAQLLAVGQHLRVEYVGGQRFLSPSLGGAQHRHFETYFRADAATRCAQSAAALGLGLYPDGTGPAGFERQTVPVTMQLLPNEHDFAAPKGPCRATLAEDLALYARDRAPAVFDRFQSALDAVGDVCGVQVDDYPTMQGGEDKVLGVKDVADMFVFDRDEGLPRTPRLTPELQAQLEELAFTNLMERYYSTDREITYWVGGFADLLLSTLNGAATPESPSANEYRFFSYHGHRELLHGLGKMIGWDFHFEGLPAAMNTTALLPGTTMFFELRAEAHPHEDGTLHSEHYFVRTFVWAPATNEREQVKLAKCSMLDCPLDEFNNIIRGHVKRTGTWQQICGYHPDPVVAHASPSLATHGDGVLSAASGYVLAATVVGSLAFAVYKAVGAIVQHRRRERDYVPI